MDVVQRQVPPDVAHVAELPQELADDRFGLSAVGALEVPVLDDRDQCVDRAAEVIPLGVDVDVEVDERLGSSEQSADPRSPGQKRCRPEEEPGDERRSEGGAEDPDFASSSWRPSNARVATSKAIVKPIPAIVPSAQDRRPTDRRSQLTAGQPSHEPGGADDAHRLADHVAEQDPERDRRGEALRQEVAVDRDPGIREREQRHDQVARPGMEELLQALVHRGRRPESSLAWRASSAVGCSRNSRNRSDARSSVDRGAGNA